MKKYLQAIFILGIILLLFPFIALPEFWQYVYVIVPSGIITFIALLMYRKVSKTNSDLVEETNSLEKSIDELKERFNKGQDVVKNLGGSTDPQKRNVDAVIVERKHDHQ